MSRNMINADALVKRLKEDEKTLTDATKDEKVKGFIKDIYQCVYTSIILTEMEGRHEP